MRRKFKIEHKFDGTKYQQTKDLDIVDIAKLVRKDINEYVNREHMKQFGIKCSVRIERYSMGRALHINVVDCNFPIYNENFNRDEVLE